MRLVIRAQVAIPVRVAEPEILPPLFPETPMVHTGETQFRAIRLQMLMHRHIRNLSRIPTHFMPMPLMRMQNLTPIRMPRRTQDRPTLVHRLARMLEVKRFPETQFRVR
ncbi:MAG: hypothetical protein CL489_01140 [Acidobacteria bacterium]|nr:hypothetical protein [Acidobacteriota bacterium]